MNVYRQGVVMGIVQLTRTFAAKRARKKEAEADKSALTLTYLKRAQ